MGGNKCVFKLFYKAEEKDIPVHFRELIKTKSRRGNNTFVTSAKGFTRANYIAPPHQSIRPPRHQHTWERNKRTGKNPTPSPNPGNVQENRQESTSIHPIYHGDVPLTCGTHGGLETKEKQRRLAETRKPPGQRTQCLLYCFMHPILPGPLLLVLWTVVVLGSLQTPVLPLRCPPLLPRALFKLHTQRDHCSSS